MYAVISTGGKQYRVEEGQRLDVERLNTDGDDVSLTPVMLVDGDTVTVGNLTLDVIHCPGHTPGHVVFHHAPSHVAMVGDVLFQGSIGRTDFPLGNHQDLWPLGADTTFVPGHGPTSTFGHERASNPYVADAVTGISG